MLWQPSHGRPIVAGRTGLDPAWYSPAREVFNEFPSEESLLLLRSWGIDSVLDARGGDEPSWPERVLLRGRFVSQREGMAPARRAPRRAETSVSPEPSPGVGAWERPKANDGGSRRRRVRGDGERDRPRAGPGDRGRRAASPRWSSTTASAASAACPRACASSAWSATSGSTSRKSRPESTSALAPRTSCSGRGPRASSCACGRVRVGAAARLGRRPLGPARGARPRAGGSRDRPRHCPVNTRARSDGPRAHWSRPVIDDRRVVAEGR